MFSKVISFSGVPRAGGDTGAPGRLSVRLNLVPKPNRVRIAAQSSSGGDRTMPGTAIRATLQRDGAQWPHCALTRQLGSIPAVNLPRPNSLFLRFFEPLCDFPDRRIQGPIDCKSDSRPFGCIRGSNALFRADVHRRPLGTAALPGLSC